MAKGIMYIDGQRVPFDGEKNVLAVIRKAGIDMPTFCYYSELSVYGACRMCVVEDERGKIETSCSMTPRDGLSIRTNTARLLKHRRMILELLLASHNCSCTTCEKSGDCRLQELAMRFGVRRVRFGDSREESQLDDSSPAVVRDPSKCILCGDCVRVCGETIGMGIIDFAQRGYNMRVSPAFNRTLSETHCISCGQCSAVCPTGAITVYNQIGKAWRAIHDPKVRTVVQIAPAVRVAVGEAFGLPAGSNALDQLVTALKYMGVDEIYDTTFAADFTTIEESREFLARLENGGPFPMFTSCCPAWVKYLELENPKYLKHISTCKSPMEMFASIVREHYQEKDAQDGRTTFHIAIMPCTAKKYEASRPELGRDGYQDVDYVLTTRELAKLIRYVGLDLSVLPESEFDSPLGTGSGAGAIFGATGGVMEAALRTAYFSHLYRIVHRQYTGRTQKVLLRALGEQIDLLNIIHVLRLKTYFPQTEPETYLRVLFPFHYRLNPDFTRALCAAPGVDDVFALLRDSPYRDCFDGVAVGAVEEYYQRAICRFNKRQLAAVPPSIYTAVAYLELKELELSVLINVIESVKYGVPYRAELADLVGQ